MKLKKGELTTQQIVTLIILVISFAILLYFLFFIKLGQESDKEVCHNSVIVKGNSILPDEATPLNCKRGYVCISADNSCEKMNNPDLHKVKTKEEVYEILATAMADCWWMFGEGEVNYAGKEISPKLHCGICSQIAFDDSMNKIFPNGNFSEEELYDYLVKNQISEEKGSYSTYIYGGDNLKKIAKDSGMVLREVDISKQYYILTGMTSVFGGTEVDAIGGFIVGAALTIIPGGQGIKLGARVVKGFVSGKTVLTGGIGGAATHYLLAPIISNAFGTETIPISFVEANSQEFDDLDCKALSTYS